MVQTKRARPGGESETGQAITGDAISAESTASRQTELGHRAETSRRLIVLPDGCRDPWPNHWPPLSPRSARSAWHHLSEHWLVCETTEAVLLREVA